ncbi:MAG: hypothetical protein Kow0040_00390 [Thermogutta sp.]
MPRLRRGRVRCVDWSGLIRAWIALVPALLATASCPAISLAASEDWTFPLPAFPEPLPGDEYYRSVGSAPLPPEFVPAEYPAAGSTAFSAHSATVNRDKSLPPSSSSVVRSLPQTRSTAVAARGAEAGFAAVDWQTEGAPYFVPSPTRVPEPSLAPGIAADEIEQEVTGVVDRQFPSGRPSSETGVDPDYHLVVREPPPGPLRRWWKGRAAPPDSPEFWRSWLEEPFSGGMAVGYFQGTALIDDWVQEKAGLVGSGRLGWDFAPNLGLETRLSFGSLELSDSFAAVAARWAADDAAGLSENDPLRRRFTDRNATAFQWDVSLLYYPTDYHPARFYLLWGAGLTRMDFTDRFGESYEGTYFTMPVGFGVKFRRLTDPIFRLEFTDNIVFPSRFNVTHHLALTAGLEFRWGAPRRRYWPWNPGY